MPCFECEGLTGRRLPRPRASANANAASWTQLTTTSPTRPPNWPCCSLRSLWRQRARTCPRARPFALMPMRLQLASPPCPAGAGRRPARPAADRQVAGRRNGYVGNGSSAVPAGTGRPCTCYGSSSPLRYQADPQALFATESVTQALRQLEVYGHEGLPVLSADGHQIPGWVTAPDVLTAIGRQITTEQARTARAQPAPTTVTPAGIDPAAPADPATRIPRSLRSPSPLTRLPPGSTPVMGLRGHRPCRPGPDPTLAPGDRVSLLALAPTAHPNPIMAANTTCASRQYPPPCVANEPTIYKRASRSPQ